MTDVDTTRGTRRVRPQDWGVIGAGVAMFLVSFLPWYSISVVLLGSDTTDAWHSGWPAILAVLSSMGAAALRLVCRLSGASSLPAATVTLLGCAVAVALIVLRWITGPTTEGLISAGPAGGLYAGLVIAVAQTVLASAVLRSSNDDLTNRRVVGS